VLRIEPLKPDMAPSAILELVDGPRDIRFAMTARTIVRERGEGKDLGEMTARNIDKVTRFRPGGQGALEEMVEKIRHLKVGERDNAGSTERRWGGNV
jgi:large subunit ribosomal protein L17